MYLSTMCYPVIYFTHCIYMYLFQFVNIMLYFLNVRIKILYYYRLAKEGMRLLYSDETHVHLFSFIMN